MAAVGAKPVPLTLVWRRPWKVAVMGLKEIGEAGATLIPGSPVEVEPLIEV